MTSVKDGSDHLLALLGQLRDEFHRDLQAAIGGPWGPRLPASVRGLRTSRLRLLSLTPAEGLRVTDLAERAGMTKQSLGEIADDLERQRLLETVRDPADRRVRILRPTRRGREAVAAWEAVIAEVEAEWRARLGPRRWDRLRELLVAAAESRRAG